MNCPVCCYENAEDSQFCEQCSWYFRMYITGISEEEQKSEKQRLLKAREIWEYNKNLREADKGLPFEAYTDSATGMEFILIKGGTFQMGDTFGDGYYDEKPVHQVTLSDFYLGKYPVTQGQWKAVMGNNPSRFNKGDNYPVEQVSWEDVQKFIKQLNRNTGKKYRLPTEAEWEYAARSGGKKEAWAGTSSESELGAYAWYSANSVGQTQPVGQKKPNGLGLYDMSGNVWEWCQDWYAGYLKGPLTNPTGPSSGQHRVLRGGSWYFNAGDVRAANRYGDSPGFRDLNIGFRVARDY